MAKCSADFLDVDVFPCGGDTERASLLLLDVRLRGTACDGPGLSIWLKGGAVASKIFKYNDSYSFSTPAVKLLRWPSICLCKSSKL